MNDQYCNRCRKEKSADQFSIARGGGLQKNCQPCLIRIKELRNQKKCKHGRCVCKECKIGVCEHGAVKCVCKICKGKGICEHNRQKYCCKDCKGKGICEHNKYRSSCRDCKGSSVCEHDKQRSKCKLCGGASVCEHDKQRSTCKLCEGVSICKHHRRKHHCTDCNGEGICKHGSREHRCKSCGGKSICKHGARKNRCKICDPGGHLTSVVGNKVRHALREDKKLRSLEYLCCDIDTLKSHLESQFTNGMSWNNYGEWQIDHITPIRYKKNGKTPSLKRIIKRLHYENLQPLWAEENSSKGNRYIG